jgi:hypothetical protein
VQLIRDVTKYFANDCNLCRNPLNVSHLKRFYDLLATNEKGFLISPFPFAQGYPQAHSEWQLFFVDGGRSGDSQEDARLTK